jgi:hypothetical protein
MVPGSGAEWENGEGLQEPVHPLHRHVVGGMLRGPPAQTPYGARPRRGDVHWSQLGSKKQSKPAATKSRPTASAGAKPAARGNYNREPQSQFKFKI